MGPLRNAPARARAARQTLRDLGPGWIARRSWDIYRVEGWRGLAGNARRASSPGRGRVAHAEFGAKLAGNAAALFPGALLHVSDVTIPQCRRYRVDQKREAAQLLGLPFLQADPSDEADMLSKLQLASAVMFYRVPWGTAVSNAFAEADRLDIPTVFETDDAVYRADLLAADPNLKQVAPKLRRSVISSAPRFMKTMSASRHVCGSTAALTADMAGYVSGDAFVIHNSVDATLKAAGEAAALTSAGSSARFVTICHGSGSLAHDRDFALAAPAIAALMDANTQVRLHLLGTVSLPVELARHRSRITQTPVVPFDEYLRHLAAADIAIAPLEDVAFNRMKSNIRYLEAATVGTAFIGSRTAYGECVRPGVNGFIADSDGWHCALTSLITDAGLRSRLASQARQDIRSWDLKRRGATEYAALLTAVTGCT